MCSRWASAKVTAAVGTGTCASAAFDRQGPVLKSLKTNFRDMREIITMKGVGHTPPEESPKEVNAIVLKFLKDIGY